MSSVPHLSVLLKEVLDAVSPTSRAIYLDATFGAGGYSNALLKSTDCIVYGVDCDDTVRKYAEETSNNFPDRFRFFTDKFSNIKSLLDGQKVDGVIFDLGVSSMQIDNAERGFSFMRDGGLDMRMSGGGKLNAHTIVNGFSEKEIANIIYKYGGERYSRRVAAKIVETRVKKEINTTNELAGIVRSVIPRKRSDRIDPATRTFQAIRIVVNDELGELKKALESLTDVVNVGGKIVVVSFHSLEDKIVKDQFNLLCGKRENGSRYHPSIMEEDEVVNFAFINKKVITPTQEEINLNPRSRSARLRAIERII